MNSNTHYWQSIVVVLVAVLALTVAPTTGSAQSFTIISPDTAEVQTGMTYGEWSAVWWQWILSIPVPSNPGFDTTGQNCQVQQSRPVFFLVGTFTGESVTRTCTVPSEMPLFFPILNAECSNVEPDPFFGSTDAARLACAQKIIDGVGIGSLKATIDGVDVAGLKDFRFASPRFDFSMPAHNNILFLPGVTSGSSRSDGYWLMFKLLSPGTHVLHFEGRFVSGVGKGFSQDVTYILTVR